MVFIPPPSNAAGIQPPDWRKALARIGQIKPVFPSNISLVSGRPFPAVPGTQGPVYTAPQQVPIASAPAGASPDATTGHWQTPDYQALIQGDPSYMQTLASISASGEDAARQRADAVRRALIGFGATPSGWQSAFGDVTPDVVSAAGTNPFSTSRQLLEARHTGSADLAAALGARGILSSGAYTGGENMLQHGYESSLNDATQQLLGALGGYEGSYTDALRQLEIQRIQALSEAASRVQANNPATFIPDPTPTTPGPVSAPPPTTSAVAPPPTAPPPINTAALTQPFPQALPPYITNFRDLSNMDRWRLLTGHGAVVG